MRRRSSHPLLLLLRTGRTLQPGPLVVWVLQGAALRGDPRNHRNPGDVLRGTARRQRCITGGPHRASGGSLSLNLAEDSVQEGRRGITFIPPDAATSLVHLEGNVVEFSIELFPLMAS